MLVLSRTKDEWIGVRISREDALALLEECDEIRLNLMVVDIRGERARLGLAADERIKIHRQEVWDDIELQSRKRQEAEIADLAEITEKAF